MLLKILKWKYLSYFIMVAVAMKYSFSLFKQGYYILALVIDAIGIGAFAATVITAYKDGNNDSRKDGTN